MDYKHYILVVCLALFLFIGLDSFYQGPLFSLTQNLQIPQAFAIFSVIADPIQILLLSTLIVGILAYQKRKEDIYFLLIALIGGQIILHLFKILFQIQRPIDAMTYAYPSGHTMMAVILIGLIWLFFLKTYWQLALLSIIPVLVGLGRIALEMHWANDVLGGLLLGVFWIVFIYSLSKTLLHHQYAHKA